MIFCPDLGMIPERWTVEDTVRCLEGFSQKSDEQIRKIIELSGRLGFRKTEDAVLRERNSPGEILAKIDRTRGITLEERMDTRSFLIRISKGREDGVNRRRSNYWRWTDSK